MSTNLDKFNEFYKLKSMYENQINKEKSTIIGNRNLSLKEKRVEFQKFKPKCVNCKRPVGSLFTVKYDDENANRIFKASCGDLVDPCNFLIEFRTNQDYLYTDMIKTLEDEVNELKNEVISYKNKVIFGYMSTEDTIEIFDKIKENINELSSYLEYNLNNFNNIVNNKEKKGMIIELKEQIYNTYILNIKGAMDNFLKTNDIQYVRDAVDIYVNILTPKLNELMGLQYNGCYVEFNEDTDTYHLIQKKYTIQDIEIPNEIIVDNYDLGPGTLAKEGSNVTKKPKARKIKKIIVDDDEGEPETIINIPTVKVPEINEPIFRADGTIMWKDPNYQRMWLKLDPKYQNVLMKDIEWLKKSMNGYIEQYKKRKEAKEENIKKPKDRDYMLLPVTENEVVDIVGYTFIPPDNLIYPPNKTEEGYDFGYKLYNDIFNNLDDFQKNVLLTLPIHEDENTGMKYAINNIIASTLNFRKF